MAWWWYYCDSWMIINWMMLKSKYDKLQQLLIFLHSGEHWRKYDRFVIASYQHERLWPAGLEILVILARCLFLCKLWRAALEVRAFAGCDMCCYYTGIVSCDRIASLCNVARVATSLWWTECGVALWSHVDDHQMF